MISIIIPVKKINNYIRESVPKILELDWPDFEILILPDQTEKGSRDSGLGTQVQKNPEPGTRNPEPSATNSKIKVRLIPSGKVGPAEKRDLAAKHAKGEILAFLDDDAYPQKNWLKYAVKHFSNAKVAAVGGPAITPADDTTGQKISGAVFESYLGGGNARNRYLPIGSSRKVDDWPSVNLLVRKDVFRKIGGFDSTYWPGEDTKLCLDIIQASYKIIYEPRAIVYHHRRAGTLKHLKQIGNYALHRGYFAKKHPQTSLKFAYFVPTLFVLYLIFIALVGLQIINFKFQILSFALLIVYCIGLFLDAVIIATRWQNPLVGLGAAPLIAATHLWYGIRFVWGLVMPKLKK
jgi:GT2 family glycosyltransferase